MQLIQTLSFQLAVYIKGNPNAENFFLFLPGFLDAGNYDHLKQHREYFVDCGYFCVSFDPPGTFSSPGSIDIYTITNYLRAIHEVIAYFGNKKTIILGHSLGGSVAMLASEQNIYIEKCIAVMSPYSYKDQFSKERYTKRKEINVRHGQRDIPDSDEKWKYAIPYSFVEDALQYDLENCLQTLTKPKLFIAGLQDDIMDIETVQQGYTLTCEPKVYREVDVGHNYRYDEEKIREVSEIVERFLEM